MVKQMSTFFADSAQRLEQLLPGFLLIDDFEWPLTPANARLRTGVYILEEMSLTVAQLTWLTETRMKAMVPLGAFYGLQHAHAQALNLRQLLTASWKWYPRWRWHRDRRRKHSHVS